MTPDIKLNRPAPSRRQHDLIAALLSFDALDAGVIVAVALLMGSGSVSAAPQPGVPVFAI